MMRVDVHLSLRQRLRMTASLLPADDTPGAPGVAPEVSTAPRLPKYYQVKRQLLELTAALDPGSPVPPERELARSYGTSRTTVRRALAELVVEGRLLRMQGKGTFVAKPKVAQPLELASYTEGMRAHGLHPQTKILDIGYVTADEPRGAPAAGAGKLHRGHARARPAPADQDPRHRVRHRGRAVGRADRRPAGRPRAAHPQAAAGRRRADVDRHLASARAGGGAGRGGSRCRSTPRICPRGASPACASSWSGTGRCTRR